MEEFVEAGQETNGYCQMIGRQNFIHREWDGGKLHMEEIVFDFLCLEDDIVEDLCKDFPAENNYERYAVARSYNFDRRKIPRFQQSSDEEPAGTTEDEGHSSIEALCCGNQVDLDSAMVLSHQLGHIGINNTQQFQAYPNKEVDQGSNGFSMNGGYKTTLDMKEAESCDPIVLNYELLPVDGHESEEQEDGLSEKMKIKVELLTDVVTGDGVHLEKSHDDKHTCETRSTTTKMKLRVPKSVIDSEDGSLRSFIINHIKEKYNQAVYMSDSAEMK